MIHVAGQVCAPRGELHGESGCAALAPPGHAAHALTPSEARADAGADRARNSHSQGKATYLVAGTEKGFIKAWEVSRKEPRQHAAARRFCDGSGVPSRLSSIAISADGTRIAASLEIQPAGAQAKPGAIGGAKATAAPLPWRSDGKLHVLLVDADITAAHDFGAVGRTLATLERSSRGSRSARACAASQLGSTR